MVFSNSFIKDDKLQKSLNFKMIVKKQSTTLDPLDRFFKGLKFNPHNLPDFVTFYFASFFL